MTTLSASFSTTSWPGRSCGQLDVREHVHPHLAAPGEHVTGVVLVRLQEDAEAGRQLGQPVHFLLQRDDLVARLPQGRGQPLVLDMAR